MINLPQGFKVGASEAIDTRFTLTLEEMNNINDNVMPQVYFTICKDDGKFYVYNKANEKKSNVGRFRIFNNDSSDLNNEELQALLQSLKAYDEQIVDLHQALAILNSDNSVSGSVDSKITNVLKDVLCWEEME